MQKLFPPSFLQRTGLSQLTVLLIAIAFSIFYIKEVRKIATNESTCLCAYDGFGYYMYLPHLANKGNLKMTRQWAQELQNEYCGGIYAYQLIPAKNGEIDVYHMGQAYLETPAFLIGHGFAKIFGYKTDGFSKPYYIAFVLNAFLFILLGLLYFRKLSLLFFSEKITSLLLIIGFIGTNYWITATLSNSLQHLYLFALISAFGYFFFKSIRETEINQKQFIISAILFGLCVVIRPTHALLGVLPGIILMQRLGLRSGLFWKYILWFPLMAFIWNIPQIIYWKIIGGQWFISNLHTEDLTFFDPYTFKFLFSYRKGWLLYTPVFLLLIPAFLVLYKKQKKLLWPFLVLTLLFIWTFSSWECWWYATSYGQRTMVDLYPLLLLPIGFLFTEIKKKTLGIVVGTVVAATLVLNIFQSWQLVEGYLPGDRMTKEHYWYIFGKTEIEKYDTHRLLIERGDTTWVEQLKQINDPKQQIESEIWYKTKQLTAKPQSDLSIIHLPFNSLKTDEVFLTVEMICSTTDTAQSAILNLQAAGKYNCYSWDNVELSQGMTSGKYTIRKVFNIPDVRHQSDYLQIYVNNQSTAAVTIHELKITATSLLRKN